MNKHLLIFIPILYNLDPLEVSLKVALANVVAATLACGRSSHLWYHMFASKELLDTYMTGFMVRNNYQLPALVGNLNSIVSLSYIIIVTVSRQSDNWT